MATAPSVTPVRHCGCHILAAYRPSIDYRPICRESAPISDVNFKPRWRRVGENEAPSDEGPAARSPARVTGGGGPGTGRGTGTGSGRTGGPRKNSQKLFITSNCFIIFFFLNQCSTSESNQTSGSYLCSSDEPRLEETQLKQQPRDGDESNQSWSNFAIQIRFPVARWLNPVGANQFQLDWIHSIGSSSSLFRWIWWERLWIWLDWINHNQIWLNSNLIASSAKNLHPIRVDRQVNGLNHRSVAVFVFPQWKMKQKSIWFLPALPWRPCVYSAV